ncbi:MAG: hypothetical protein DWB43_00560 [Lautropia sp.]|mgnify:CR=1 FL=1|nr:hypothetical protein [Lautropia sp.]MBW7925697.1 hypothetical protein [Burkholderiaceae bacterium]MDL1905949.1 hypothetical protein [Betaproteobacteria bacterium PRO1]MEB2335046.1 ethylbenzene dehydrogenase-related protein [Burkholderiales bacterium]MCL4700527.1 hypothetical protein [Burkholderiaceae bacterium]
MSAREPIRGRRPWLTAPFAVLGGWLALPARDARAAEKASLLARPVDAIPDDPDAPAWQQSDVLEVPLAPQAVVKPRRYEAGVKSIEVRALYSEERLAVRLAWHDAQQDVMKGAVQAFRDAIALEFPYDPAKGIPFFGMGERERPVVIYQWKSDWAADNPPDVDEKYPDMAVDWYPFSTRSASEIAEATDYGKSGGDKAFITSWWAGNALTDPALQSKRAVEKLIAHGFGTLEPVPADEQDGESHAQWKDGMWRTVISIPRAQEAFSFARGKTVPFAFAAWNGAKQERGAEKAVSTWYFLSLEQPTSSVTWLAPVAVVAGVFAAQMAGLRKLRERAARRGD